MKKIKKFNENFDEEGMSSLVRQRIKNDKYYTREIYDKARGIFIKLSKIEDGNYNYFWVNRRDNTLDFGITINKSGREIPLVDLDDFMDDSFTGESFTIPGPKSKDISPGYLIDKYLL